MSGIVEGKNFLITGVRNKWSIAWASAQSLHKQGARLSFSVFGDREEGSVAKLLADSGIAAPIFQCNATDEEQVATLFTKLGEHFDGKLDGLLHSIAFSKKEELAGEYIATSKEGFLLAHENSVYTMVTLARGARPLLQANGGGSIVTLTYLGSERVVPNYNIMGVAKASLEATMRYLASDLGKDNIRVNAVSAGPIKTLAAGGISGFDTMLKRVEELSPLGRKVDVEEVGDAVMFFLSPLSRAITGETVFVDAGYHIVGMVS